MLTTLAFGTTSDGTEAHLYQLSNSLGMTASITDYGACLVSVRVPAANDSILDVALGHTGVRGYEHNSMGFGATVGRNANRIGGACFSLGETMYQLTANENGNSLHSGPDLWFQRMWQVEETDEDHVTFSLDSPDGDQGFPGSVHAMVTYLLTEDDRLVVRYDAMPSEETVINLTNHTYFNLDGHASGDILAHKLTIDAESYTPVDKENIPTGEIASVDDTPFDLRQARPLAEVLPDLPRGLDHNFCLKADGEMAHAARLVAGHSGIALDVYTDAPGIQVYMAGFLDDMRGKDGAPYGRFSGIALETQFWPDSINHPEWPRPIFSPEHRFVSTTEFAFSTE